MNFSDTSAARELCHDIRGRAKKDYFRIKHTFAHADDLEDYILCLRLLL